MSSSQSSRERCIGGLGTQEDQKFADSRGSRRRAGEGQEQGERGEWRERVM